MKKILIVSDSLRTGGIQSSLKSFLKNLPKDKFEVELFLFNDEGLKEAKLDKDIHVRLGSKILQTVSCSSDYARHGGALKYLARKIFALLCKIFTSKTMYSLVFAREIKIDNIDIALSYSNNVSNRSVYFGYNLFTLKKVESKKKIAYIHLDYNLIKSRYTNSEYRKFDEIWAVSNYVKKSIAKTDKTLDAKCHVVYNFIDTERFDTVTSSPYKNKKFHIVTVGRLDKNKSQIDAIKIAEDLIKTGAVFEWYLVGDGPERAHIEEEIRSKKLDEYIIMTGNVDSVGYIKFADLLVSLSKNESYGLVIAEALYCDINVLSRRIPAAEELLPDKSIYNTSKEIVDKIKTKINESHYGRHTNTRNLIVAKVSKEKEELARILEGEFL